MRLKFTLDGGLSLYDFRDESDEDNGQVDLKQLIGKNWIDPPKRDRKRVLNYSESDYYKQTMKTNKPDRVSGPRLPKMPQLQDFQFFDLRRLTQLFEKENAHEVFKYWQKQKEEAARGQGATEEDIKAQIAPGPDDPQPLSEEEIAEKDRLLESGFTNWNRRDFNAFIRACEKYGRDDIENVAKEIEGRRRRRCEHTKRCSGSTSRT